MVWFLTENFNDYEEVTVVQTPTETNIWDFHTFIYTQEFLFLSGIGVVVLMSLVVMCAACIASSKKKPRRPPGYDRAATQVQKIAKVLKNRIGHLFMYLYFRKWK